MSQLLSVNEGRQTGETIYFDLIECADCGSPFMITARLRENLKKSKDTFYCPLGHGQSYTKSTEQILKEKLEAEKLRHEKELEQANNKLLDEMNRRQRAEKQKKKSERQLKRVHNGVCPCCNRSFTNLQRHMQTKHPEVAPIKSTIEIHKKINAK